MGQRIADGVHFYKLPPVSTTGGDVLHGIKGLDEDLPGFAECYFSTVNGREPKAWKKHSEMICNLFVPFGAVEFVFYDERLTHNGQQIAKFVLSAQNYGRLVIHPGIWFGFAGLTDQKSIILNVANIIYRPEECVRLEPFNQIIPFNWTDRL